MKYYTYNDAFYYTMLSETDSEVTLEEYKTKQIKTYKKDNKKLFEINKMEFLIKRNPKYIAEEAIKRLERIAGNENIKFDVVNDIIFNYYDFDIVVKASKLDDNNIVKLDKCIKEIEKLIEQEKIPEVEKDNKCKKCAYYEYCYL